MEAPLRTRLETERRRAEEQLTRDGIRQVELYADAVWNDDKLTREHIIAIACRLLLMQ